MDSNFLSVVKILFFFLQKNLYTILFSHAPQLCLLQHHGLRIASPVPGDTDDTWPTPEVRTIEVLEAPSAITFGMRGELGNTGQYVGLGLVCATQGPHSVNVVGYFGAYPGTSQPVQLAVRSASGKVERFGTVVTAGPESGFHSPQLTDPDEATRFVRIALQPGALVSNGYRSFWNRASARRNQEVRQAFLACAKNESRQP